jgi:hypothetical protein
MTIDLPRLDWQLVVEGLVDAAADARRWAEGEGPTKAASYRREADKYYMLAAEIESQLGGHPSL